MNNSLKAQVFTGLKWSFIAKGVTQAFSWISTFFVIRWLTPEDYGIMAIAMVFFSLISYFTTNGLTSVLVRDLERSARLENQMFTFSLLLNVFLSALLLLSALWMVDYYQSADLFSVMATLAVVNPITSFSVVPVARLQRDMKFKEKSIIESVAAIFSAFVACAMAYSGYGYWSLVISTAAMMVARTLLFRCYTTDWPTLTRDWAGVKPALSYAWHLQFGTLIWFAYNRADTLILGRILGMEKLGIYNVASDIASIPLSKGTAILNDVGFAAFTKVQDNPGLAKHYASRALFLIGLVMFPVFYGIAAVSDELVLILLGDKWTDAGPIIFILCLIFPFRIQASVLSNFANGMGDARFGLHNVMFISAILIFSIIVGAQFGLNGAAWGWVTGYSVAYAILLARFKIRYHFTVSQLLPFLVVWSLSGFMLLTLMLIQPYVAEWHVVLVLLVKMVLGAMIIMPIAMWRYWPALKSIFKKDITPPLAEQGSTS